MSPRAKQPRTPHIEYAYAVWISPSAEHSMPEQFLSTGNKTPRLYGTIREADAACKNLGFKGARVARVAIVEEDR